MGRWAQRQRRGGGPPGAPTIVVRTIVGVFLDLVGNQMTVAFDGAITYDGLGVYSGFEVDDGGGFAPFSTVVGSGSDFVILDAPGPLAFGMPWQQLTTPPELAELVTVPVAGTLL